MDYTAAYPTDYASIVVAGPILTKQDMVPSVVYITDGRSILCTGQTIHLEIMSLTHGSNSSTSLA